MTRAALVACALILAGCEADTPAQARPIPDGPFSMIALEGDSMVFAEVEPSVAAEAINSAMDQNGDRLVEVAPDVYIVPSRVVYIQ